MAPTTIKALPTLKKAGWRIAAARVKKVVPEAISRQPATLFVTWIFKRFSY